MPHLDALYGGAFRLTKNQSDASDLVQEACLRAFRFWHSFDGDNCRAWLFKIMTNVFYSEFNRRKRRSEVMQQAFEEQNTSDGVLFQAESRGRLDPRSKNIKESLSTEVEQALNALSPEYRLVVVLCDMQGFSYKEIAEIIDCPIGTVMSRIHRARKQLAESLLTFAKEEGIVKGAQVVSMKEYRGAAKK